MAEVVQDGGGLLAEGSCGVPVQTVHVRAERGGVGSLEVTVLAAFLSIYGGIERENILNKGITALGTMFKIIQPQFR